MSRIAAGTQVNEKIGGTIMRLQSDRSDRSNILSGIDWEPSMFTCLVRTERPQIVHYFSVLVANRNIEC